MEQPSRRDSFAEFQPNILELFLGRLWSVELCFYQAAGSFNKIFMTGKVLFMEIRLLKCLLGGGPHQPAFLPPLPPSSPSGQFPHSASSLPSSQPPAPRKTGALPACVNMEPALAGRGAPRGHVEVVDWAAK